MLHRQGFTLIEMIVVLIIIAITTAISLFYFYTPSEQALALNAQNNLLAIYSAEQNFRNNYGFYCTKVAPYDCNSSLSAITTALSLNIQDDGSYVYYCSFTQICTAARNNDLHYPLLVVTLYAPINLNGGAGGNPSCNPGGTNWCP